MNHLQLLTILLAAWCSLATNIFAESKKDAATSPAESGFIELFNGKDLTGWNVEGTKTYKIDGMAKDVWTVQDGLIHCAGAGYGFLRYDKPFTDFIFKLQFRAAPKCNSGVGIRHVKFTGVKNSRPSFSGYEIQLLDDHDVTPDTHSTGSLYRFVAAKASAVKPAGAWNDFEVDCRGPQIKITINGKVVQDIDQRTVSEIADKPLSGYVSVQNHGGRVEFRNLRLKELN